MSNIVRELPQCYREITYQPKDLRINNLGLVMAFICEGETNQQRV